MLARRQLKQDTGRRYERNKRHDAHEYCEQHKMLCKRYTSGTATKENSCQR